MFGNENSRLQLFDFNETIRVDPSGEKDSTRKSPSRKRRRLEGLIFFVEAPATIVRRAKGVLIY